MYIKAMCIVRGWNHSSIVDKSLHLAGYVGVKCTCLESEFASLLRGDLLKEWTTLSFGVNSPFWYFTPLEWLTDGVKYTHFWSDITPKFLQCSTWLESVMWQLNIKLLHGKHKTMYMHAWNFNLLMNWRPCIIPVVCSWRIIIGISCKEN